MQELMLSVLGVGGKVFVLDYGRSFKRTCLILGGSYIEFDIKNPVSINPFSEVPEDDSAKSIEARSDFLSNFPSILATMAAPQYGTSDLQQPMLQRALTLALLSLIYSMCSSSFNFRFSYSFCYVSVLKFC
ncbi:AAA-like domain protein [Orientia tsutsugamushi str. UT76]|nr:AAA-like domain protein [Orientia tsutsugamushi str. UT76]